MFEFPAHFLLWPENTPLPLLLSLLFSLDTSSSQFLMRQRQSWEEEAGGGRGILHYMTHNLRQESPVVSLTFCPRDHKNRWFFAAIVGGIFPTNPCTLCSRWQLIWEDANVSSVCKQTHVFCMLIFVYFFQALMTSVSRQIYDTTNGRGRFGELNIIVPSSWSGEECLKSRFLSTRDRSASPRENDFTVDNSHPIFGTDPRVDQFGQCGIGGSGIHLPYSILTDEVRITEKSREFLHLSFNKNWTIPVIKTASITSIFAPKHSDFYGVWN